MTAEAEGKRTTYGRTLFKWALAVHVLGGGLVLLTYNLAHANIEQSALMAALVDFGSQVFGVIDHAFLCRKATRINVALVTAVTYTAHLVLLAMLVRDWRLIWEMPPERIGYVDTLRMALIGLFGVSMYYFTFFLLGGEGTTPGYNVLCIHSPKALWIIWTAQTLLIAMLVHMCWPFFVTLALSGLRKIGALRRN